MSNLVRWGFPTTVIFGVGAAGETGRVAKEQGATRVLLVTDAFARDHLAAPILKSLSDAGIETAVFAGVQGNPIEANVDDGHTAYREAGADAVVALGGGSVLDAAKVIALRVNHGRPLADYDDAIGGDLHVTGVVPPIIALPTTAGTGSEVGRSGVVTLKATGRKTVIFAPKLLPVVALLDPALTVSMPAAMTAATGYDALTHCIEAFVAQGDHPMADGIALEGIALAAGALERATKAPGDLEARGAMMKAAMMGAVAFQKGLGACHSLAHPLSTQFGVHHGLANALCLPETVAFNLGGGGKIKDRYDRVVSAMGASGDPVHVLAALRERLGLESGLSRVGVTEAAIEALATEAFDDACHRMNPRPCTRDDLAELYRKCL